MTTSEPNSQDPNPISGDYIHGDKSEKDLIKTVHGNIYIYQNADGSEDKSIPNQLPRRTTQHFTGRAADLDWIKYNLASKKTLVVSGHGGIGKTTLVIEALNQLYKEDKLQKLFPDGIIFHSFYGRPQIELAFETILDAFGVEARGDAGQQVRSLLSSKHLLMILDGCEHVDKRESLHSVLDVLGQCGVIATTRATSQGHLGKHINLRHLEEIEAIRLLEIVAKPMLISDKVSAEICNHIDYLPLGIDIAASYIREWEEDPLDYLIWLRQKPFEALNRGEARRDSIGRMVAKSVSKVGNRSKTIFLILGQMAYFPIPVWAIESMLQVERRGLNQDLRDLSRYGLIKLEKGKVLCSHALLHGFARDLYLINYQEASALLQSIWKWFSKNYKNWQSEIPPAFHNCDLLRPHVIIVLDNLEKQKSWFKVNDLVLAVEKYLDLKGHFTERIQVLNQGIKSSKYLNNHRNEGLYVGRLGKAYYSLGHVTDSVEYFKRALTISIDINDRKGEALHLGYLGNAYRNLGETRKGISFSLKALKLSRETGDKKSEGVHLGGLGNACNHLDQFEEAIVYFNKALEIAKEIQDRRGEVDYLGGLGNAYRKLGDINRGVSYFEEALEIARRIGDRRGEGNQIGNLGNAYRNLGEIDRAISLYEEALKITDEIGDKRGYAIRLGYLGILYRDNVKNNKKAREYWLKALPLYDEMKHPYANDVRDLINGLDGQ